MKTSKNIAIFLILIVAASCAAEVSDTVSTEETLLTKYVNPLIGTAPLTDTKIIGYTPPEGWRVWAGLTYPGVSLPNAMVQLSPVTEYGTGAGYEYEDSVILGLLV